MLRKQSSRLKRTSDKQNKKQAVVFTIAIVVLIIALFEFGPFFINVFGNVIFTLRGEGKSDTVLVGKEVLQPPLLNDVPNATQSARIDINGTLFSKKGVVELYVNEELFKEVEIKNTDSFEVKNIPLKTGLNSLKTRVTLDKQTSAFSKVYQVTYVKDKPKLEVTFPSNNQTFTKADKKITVTGTTDQDNTVSVNSFQAIVNSDGKFSYLLELKDGDNQIIVTAQNSAGLSTQNQLKVTYNP